MSKYLEAKLELEESMECEESKRQVSQLYDKYEEAYKSQRRKSRDSNERIAMYFKFKEYINRKW